jgi:putative membrane protein
MLGAAHMVLWWVLIVLGIAVLAKWLLSSSRPGADGGALAILMERYARGEIEKEEYEQSSPLPAAMRCSAHRPARLPHRIRCPAIRRSRILAMRISA